MALTGLLFTSSDSSASRTSVFDESHFLFPQSNFTDQANDILVINGAVLSPLAPPFLFKGKSLGAALDATTSDNGAPGEVLEYVVGKGDTLKLLAQKFNITIETIAWANNLSTQAKLTSGQKLVILPVSGVLHIVRRGDTVSGLSQIYKAAEQGIVEFNELPDENAIAAGDVLVIPGGKKPKVVQPQQKYIVVPLSNSYFIAPVASPYKIAQGLHWFNAIDFSTGECGSPVFAVAGGEVQKTSYGSNSGNYITIMHPNGAITHYGHLSKMLVKAGEKVSQGQVIGNIGSTGKTIPQGSAGCHLHFDVLFAANPFVR